MQPRSNPTLQPPDDVVDLRSDTVTRPTEAMYERMRMAQLGDDGLDGDPTARELEDFGAHMLGKQNGLFVPSCTMANLLAVLSLTCRTDQIIVEQGAHIYATERGPSVLAGVTFRPISGAQGIMDLEDLEETLKLDRKRTRTSLMCLETSHGSAGGVILPMEHIEAAHGIARRNDMKMHLDGARMFNAAASMGVEPANIAALFDTVSVCLSKGLSAPAGALLVGSRDTIAEARRLRKILGGTQRQIGVLAAAGLEAISAMRGRLVEDHERAMQLSRALNDAGLRLVATRPDTNIVQIDVSETGKASPEWVSMLEGSGIKTRAIDSNRLRCVTHRHINPEAVDRAVEAFTMIDSKLLGSDA